MIKAIIWDIGGVLAKMDNLTSHQHWEQRLGLETGQLAKTVFNNPLAPSALIGQVTETAFWLDVGQQLGLSAADTIQLKADFVEAGVWDQTLLELIESLKLRFKMAILSGAMSDARELVQAQINTDLFEVMVFSAEEGVQKPDPIIYQRTLSRLGVEPHEAIFIDDWLDSVEGARGVGLYGIHYTAEVDVKAEIERIVEQVG